MINGIKNKVVTSIYNLNYVNQRGGGVYKGFDLLTKTIRNIIFDDYEYVIYTNKETHEMYNLSSVFNYPNITIKHHELNSDFYKNVIEPCRQKKLSDGHIWDRIHSVDNYVEVMYNKFDFLYFESKNYDGNVFWVDAGLFGTSCGNGWRDYMSIIAHTKSFLDKVFEKIDSHGFISLKGNNVVSNYQEKEWINKMFDTSTFIIPGGLFGGKSNLIMDYFFNYKDVIKRIIDEHGFYTSDQEILWVLLNKQNNVKFFEFDDWDDLQRGVLKIMDLYDENTYNKISPEMPTIKNINKDDLKKMSFTEVADFFGIDKGSLHESHMYTEFYEKYLDKFKNQNFNMVEIGINDTRFPGKCIEFWDSLFDKINYHGFDIVDCSHFNYNKEKVKIFKGDQNNPEDLNNMIKNFNLSNVVDVIIDDGSHVSEHILTSFKTLIKNLKKDGYYFIEDLHAGAAEREKTIEEIKLYIKNENIEITNFILSPNNKLLIIQK